MFSKTFKTKSYNSLKGSTRKTLVQRIKKDYPNLTENDLAELIPMKASLALMKVVLINEEECALHIADNVPVLMEKDDHLCPTIFGMWRCPDMLPSVTIYPTLMGRIQEGSYNVNKNHIFSPPKGTRWPAFRKGDLVSVNMENNKASVLIGSALYASCDIPLVQMGQCVKTIQMLGDLLCRFEKFVKVERPILEPPYPKEEEKPCEEITAALEQIEISNGESLPTVDAVEEDEIIEEKAMSPTEEMDHLLVYCLLCVLKSEGKKMALPVKTNLFYANQMAKFCPPEKSLDVKKSSYKKMAKFLEQMETEGILQVKPIEKGVDAIVSVNHDHALIKSHVIENGLQETPKNKSESSLSLKDLYRITAAVVPLFSNMQVKKGEVVPPSQVSAAMDAYIKSNNLQDPQNKNLIILDAPLTKLINAKVEKMPWEELKTEILKKMTRCTELAFSDGSTAISTGKTPLITMQVANRSGNKKVTIVSHVHFYGINLNQLSKECQHGVAASCTITKYPGSKYDQLQIQGDQTYFLTKHLIETYKLPKRVIVGADKYLKSKKK